MEIYVVRAGDTLSAVARRFGIPLSLLASINGASVNAPLAVGQALLVLFPSATHTVRAGETVADIAARYGMTVRGLYRNNPVLGGVPRLSPGQTLVIRFTDTPAHPLLTTAYAPPHTPTDLLRSALPFLTFLAPFTCGFTEQGHLIPPNDTFLPKTAVDYDVLPLLHVSTLTAERVFSNALSHTVLADPAKGDVLIDEIVRTVVQKGFAGADVDFEFTLPSDAVAYGRFLARLQMKLEENDRLLFAALSPKTTAAQRGLLCEGHDYAAVGAAADYTLLMTYAWGHAYAPPQAVAPLPQVRRVVAYGVSEMPAKKIFLGMPNYGYDRILPFTQGVSRAEPLSPEQAVARAARHGAEIRFDEVAAAPFFNYRDQAGRTHEVWFEDPRSTYARLQLPREYGLAGVGYWDVARRATANFMVLNALYRVE